MLKSQEWRLTFTKLNRNHSQRPDIHLLIVALFLNKFRGHPGRSSDNRLSIELTFGELDSESEISNFDVSLKIYQNIITFEISMELFPFMKSLKPFEDLLHKIGDDVLGNSLHILIHEISHGSTIHELNKHEQWLFVVICEEVLGEIFAAAHRHDGDLSLDFLKGSLVFKFDDAARVVVAVLLVFIIREENFAHGTLAQLSLEYVLFSWIFLNKLNLFNNVFELFGCENLRLYFALLQFIFVTWYNVIGVKWIIELHYELFGF